jgi:uncharacterized protein (DUF58 family)
MPPRHEGDGIGVTLEQLCALQAQARGLNLHSLTVPPVEAGEGHRSRFRSRGMEYVESRPYLPGDDIRSMDWRVTARSGRPHTKLYREESERRVFLLVDLGASMHFGTRRSFKSVVAAETAALMCWATVQHGDRLGVLVYDGMRRLQVRDRKGRSGALSVLQALVTLAQAGRRPLTSDSGSLRQALRQTRRVVRPGTLVTVISDFAALDAETEQEFVRLGRHNEMIVTLVYDPLEESPPPPGRYAVTDGRDAAVIDTRSAALRAAYANCFEQRRRDLQALAVRLRMTLISLRTDAEVAPALGSGLAGRGVRSGRRPGARGKHVV